MCWAGRYECPPSQTGSSQIRTDWITTCSTHGPNDTRVAHQIQDGSRYDMYSSYLGSGAQHRRNTDGDDVRRTGVPRSYETPPPQDPKVGLCLGPCGGLKRGGAVSYERGTPSSKRSLDKKRSYWSLRGMSSTSSLTGLPRS